MAKIFVNGVEMDGEVRFIRKTMSDNYSIETIRVEAQKQQEVKKEDAPNPNLSKGGDPKSQAAMPAPEQSTKQETK